MKLRQNGTVSFSIKLAAFQASGWAEPGTDQFRINTHGPSGLHGHESVEKQINSKSQNAKILTAIYDELECPFFKIIRIGILNFLNCDLFGY